MGGRLYGRRGWFWKPVGLIFACGATASSVIFTGAVLAGSRDGSPGLAIFLTISGLAVTGGPAVLMAVIADSVRSWVDPNFYQTPPRNEPAERKSHPRPDPPEQDGIPVSEPVDRPTSRQRE